MNFQAHRPPDHTGPGDAALPRLIRNLKRVLAKTQNKFAHDTLRLEGHTLEDLAHILVEFGEDLHNDLGLWRSLEQYNRDFFGTPLPLTLPVQRRTVETPSTEERVCHFLWVLYTEINPDLTLAPTHQDLRFLAGVVANFLDQRLKKVPRRSGLKAFLGGPNRFGWEVKRKLIWLGRHAYLFRHSFQNYVAAHGGQANIATSDDFICQDTTAWSGLGAVDILAAALPLTESQRATLRRWSERHLAYYRVVAAGRSRLELVNLINEQPYQVRMDDNSHLFKGGQIIFGSLVPWEGQWYWSGEQRSFEAVPEATLREMRERLIQTAAQIVYRYHQSRLQKAKETVERLQQVFLDTFGDELAIFPDGLSMAASLQKMYRLYNERMPVEVRTPVLEKHGLSSAAPKMPYPAEIIENENGIAVFYNPDEGLELMINFNDVLNGLKKRGLDLSEDEELALQKLMESQVISPNFVKRLVRDDGAESIAVAYLIRNYEGQPYLDYLLRRYKGHFYRNRYPAVTLV